MNQEPNIAINIKKYSLSNIINLDLKKFCVFDFSNSNFELKKIDLTNPADFQEYINLKISEKKAFFGVGKYKEERIIYNHSKLFSGNNPRTIHLGIDLFVPYGTEVFCPIEGVVHSVKHNDLQGDYGPTIILEHNLDALKFYTLYGHLSIKSIENIEPGKKFKTGAFIGHVGTYPTNGGWPSHLHFQIIKDLLGNIGDFPGVCSSDDKDLFFELCPDPNIILRLPLK